MARLLNGTTDQINCGSSATLKTAAMTQAMWVYPISLTNAYNQALGWGGGGHGVHILIKSTGAVAVYCTRSNSTTASYDPGSHTLSNATWAHVAMTYDSTNGLIGYVNGASDGTAASLGLTLITTDAIVYGIGFDPTAAGRNFPGRMSHAAQWNVALTAAEILALSQGALPINIRPKSLAGYWPLDGLASPEIDLSGNANNGTLTGTSLAAGPPAAMFTPRWPTAVLPVSAVTTSFCRVNMPMLGM